MGGKRAPRIAFYDSGVGGLPYYGRARDLIDGADFYYLADSLNFPLGVKDRETALAAVRDSVAKLIAAARPDLIVIACNTASMVALAELRRLWPKIGFVGTVPAVKPAAALSKTGTIAVIATDGAVRDTYMAELIRDFAPGLRVELRGMGDWVEFVEKRWLGSGHGERMEIVSPLIDELIAMGVDAIVLACTHFLFLEEEIAERAAGRAIVIDSSEGVAARSADLLKTLDLDAGQGKEGAAIALPGLYSTSANALAEKFALRFGLSYRGVLR